MSQDICTCFVFKIIGCFPKEILKRMNVTGLTRMQVASHLQVRFLRVLGMMDVITEERLVHFHYLSG